jgi:hypothetical protein
LSEEREEMTARELIDTLQDLAKHGLSLDDEVKVFDPDSGKIESVTGMLHGGTDHVIEFCTDDDDEGMEPKKERKYYDGHGDRSVCPTDTGTSRQGTKT